MILLAEVVMMVRIMLAGDFERYRHGSVLSALGDCVLWYTRLSSTLARVTMRLGAAAGARIANLSHEGRT